MRRASAILSLALLAASPALAFSGKSSCITAKIPAPIVLPDGSEHAAGRLTVCVAFDYSPVAALHEVSIDDVAVGLLQSRRGTSEGPGDASPFMMFLRHGDGRLELYGCAVPGRSHMNTFLLQPIAETGSAGTVRIAGAVSP